MSVRDGGPMQIREGDVFSFCYSAVERAKRYMPYHCFDGQLVVIGGKLLDTYWLHGLKDKGGGDGYRFTLAEAVAQGELTFKCNLGEVEIVPQYKTEYFADADVFDLSYQHRCYPYWAVRKGATRSKEKIAAVIAAKIEAERANIRSAKWVIERLTAEAEKVQHGELSEVYL